MAAHKHGFNADRPSDIPALGWWDVSKRLYHSLSQDNLSLVAAGVAFYALLAIFPALAAVVSIYAYFSSPTEMVDQLLPLIELLPPSSQEIMLQQLKALTQKSQTSLSLGAIFTLFLTIWSSSKGCQALITACNITYHEHNKRQFLQALVVRFLFSVGAIFVAIVALSIIGILPIVLNLVGFTTALDSIIQLITWSILAALFHFSLAFVYRYAPHRRAAKWRWITLGSFTATGLWILASLGFSYYVAQFASYNETYGSLGGVVIMMMWLYLSAYIIIFGAALNASTELQTLKDSTVGPEKERGQRGAFVADNLTTRQRQEKQ
ncbi:MULTISPECIES: YihY/virulence factor BrkB family protein [Pseudoalteromonas]|uniref:YihY/virulence factor BrkB family protein n=1 Tax=Pseudoalteromonas maricaloris TaxID=184924 RepID=A0A8I2H714_9GAMM|nr:MULTISPECIES: YihY/virulence factor BrkB family protein [Pseudoalteromonas]KID36787.1 membrane protein [Pseudoalteromonas flavipulchra NCIMB 2033 = ATCC BAA-314]MBD0782326.1 YihY/virulence factor BrkB family protein [Pseudoalteromonas flavipulchra]MBE0374067.1 membrane protein [Pseudoalteromonas flavipulchra NCIMB 2033 = ATCC BAA-314]NLR22349.1 YihY/virulence factor BrkB family protein [Pseudoalteromonas maricaloris]RZG17337.1 YihY/virulence factor BrkB family protein [Pseudoalteromonas sp.